MKRYSRYTFLLELAPNYDTLPISRLRRETSCVFLAASVVEIGRRGAVVKVHRIVVKRWLPAHSVVLKYEIAQAVKDGPVLVYLDAPKKMRSMTGEQSAALVYGKSRRHG